QQPACALPAAGRQQRVDGRRSSQGSRQRRAATACGGAPAKDVCSVWQLWEL
ncbi:hypothetical protein IW150_004514, partial [Coemansia sp. RSA 2607]